MTAPRPQAHRGTTAQLQALYPFVAEPGLGVAGAYIGQDLLGGAFAYDPWELYRAGRVTSPNALVIGQIGRGKAAKDFPQRSKIALLDQFHQLGLKQIANHGFNQP